MRSAVLAGHPRTFSHDTTGNLPADSIQNLTTERRHLSFVKLVSHALIGRASVFSNQVLSNHIMSGWSLSLRKERWIWRSAPQYRELERNKE